MKKFLFVLILLIILGGVIFLLGWTQLTVPPGSYGVMHSKTHGLEERVISDGEFRWLWYKILPTNTTVSVFNLYPVRHSIRSSGSLSSGQVYASLAGLDAEFNWEITGDIVFSIKPEYLPALTARENVSDDSGLREVERGIAANIERLLLQRIKTYADSGDETRLETLRIAGTLPELDREIETQFPEIENFSCIIRSVRFPDYQLYRSVKRIYDDYLARQNELLRQEVTKEAETRIDTRTRIDELAMYGELLTKYPILLQFMALEKGIAPKD